MLLFPPPDDVSHYENSTFLFFLKKYSIPRVKMVKRSDKTNTGEGDKGKKSRTVSDDSGGKSLSDTSTSAVCEVNCDTHQCEHI